MSWGDEIVLWLVLAAATFTDLKTGKIYNLITLPVLGLGICARFFYGGWDACQISLLAVGTAFLLFFPLYYLKIFGAGDVKLLMAVAAWTNSSFVMQLGAVAILIGAVVGLSLLLKKYGIKGSVSSLKEHVKMKASVKSVKMPFAPAFLCAFVLLQVAQEYQWSII